MYGEPDGTIAYDVPLAESSFSPFADSRIGPSYTSFKNASCMTQKCWVDSNGLDYDALRGQAVIKKYARAVDSLTRRCTGADRAETGSWCTTLDNYGVACGSTTCTFTHEAFSYNVGPIRVPGAVRRELFR